MNRLIINLVGKYLAKSEILLNIHLARDLRKFFLYTTYYSVLFLKKSRNFLRACIFNLECGLFLHYS
jgi:hypothetical protein